MTLRLQPVFSDLTKLSTATSDEIKAMWTIVTKAKDSIDYGYRLENLSWRLWYSSTVSQAHNHNAQNNIILPSENNLPKPSVTSVNNSSAKIIQKPLPQKVQHNAFKINTKNNPSHTQSCSGASSVNSKILNSFSHILEEIQEASHLTRDSSVNSPAKGNLQIAPLLLNRPASSSNASNRSPSVAKKGYTSNANVGVNRGIGIAKKAQLLQAINNSKALVAKPSPLNEDSPAKIIGGSSDRITVGFVPVKFSRTAVVIPEDTDSFENIQRKSQSSYHPYANSSIIHHPRYTNLASRSAYNAPFVNPILLELEAEKLNSSNYEANSPCDTITNNKVTETSTKPVNAPCHEKVNFFIAESAESSNVSSSSSSACSSKFNFMEANVNNISACTIKIESTISNYLSTASTVTCSGSGKPCHSLLSSLLVKAMPEAGAHNVPSLAICRETGLEAMETAGCKSTWKYTEKVFASSRVPGPELW